MARFRHASGKRFWRGRYYAAHSGIIGRRIDKVTPNSIASLASDSNHAGDSTLDSRCQFDESRRFARGSKERRARAPPALVQRDRPPAIGYRTACGRCALPRGHHRILGPFMAEHAHRRRPAKRTACRTGRDRLRHFRPSSTGRARKRNPGDEIMDRRGGALPANTTDGRRSDHDSRTASALPRRDIFVFGLCKSDDNAESTTA
jgi:hypothetical protein